ncbi:MAG: zinc-binding protein [Candidatus Brocadiia bacterium]|nr:MAG: zinc-binding protein [Candidatus Brocadiia bacterium]
MSQKNSCSGSGGPKLIFACSGAADVGAIADQAARKMAKEGVGKMFCTVGIGGRVSGIMKTTESAEKILAIDGCPLNCVKNSLEQAGFNKFGHLQLADLGMEKGNSPVTEENINKVAAKGKEMIT